MEREHVKSEDSNQQPPRDRDKTKPHHHLIPVSPGITA